MGRARSTLVFAVILLLGVSENAPALVAGGGPAKSDCYAEWQVTTPELGANRGRVGVDCQDGDPRCDVDGETNGTCVFGVSICVFQSDVARCQPREVTAVTLPRRTASLGLQAPPVPASVAACGPAALLPLALRTGRRAARPSKTLRLGMTATSSGKPRKDRDSLVLRCIQNVGAAQCPANPRGGPRELAMAVAAQGTDLDNGWSGFSHNFPVVFGTRLSMCLTGCDASTNPACTEDEASTDQVNGRTFGPPLPLFAAGVPVCLVNRFATPKMIGGTANVQSGAVSATMNLLSDVFLTSPTQLCPRCSGSEIGSTGTCDSGARQGQACRTEGILTVTTAPGNRTFRLSSDCTPPGNPTGTLTITLPLTTGTSTLAGPRPCGASQDDGCGVGTCNARCTGPACESTTADGQCVDTKGGVSQLCCSSDTTRPCFPTAGGGQIVRTGAATAPTPAWPEATYPKMGSGTLVATFCEPPSANTVNAVTGLPGPGALTLPVGTVWIP